MNPRPSIAGFCIGLLVAVGSIAGSLEKASSQSKDDFTIKVGVEEVRLDVVVLDRKGRQAPDLTEKDFDVYQDNKRQEIVSIKYISAYGAKPEPLQSGANKQAKPVPGALSRLAREDVQRTIVFLVDDLSMRKFPQIHRARMCIKKYVEDQMQPGDMVAIMQTFRGTASLSAFTSDKRELLARVDTIHWKHPYDLPDPRIIEDYIPQWMAIDFCIRALKDMPGRKFLMLLSMHVSDVSGMNNYSVYNRLADSAMRAGVVIHTLDIMGLADAVVDAQPVVVGLRIPSNPGPISDSRYQQMELGFRQSYKPLPLSQKTGGVFLTGRNFFIDGIKDLEEDMKGYYLLTYIPPKSASRQKDKAFYNQIKVKVKRPGYQVRTRDGYIDIDRSLETPAETQNPLIKAMFSPFQYKDLEVDMAAGYRDDGEKGYSLKTWVHLDGNAVGISKEQSGRNTISVEAMAAATDVDGVVQETAKRKVDLALSDAEVQWIREHGLKFSLSLAKENAGAYYVRVAIKDHISGSIGSAYEFLEIPDLSKDALALSSIVILNNEEDVAWIQSGAGKDYKEQNVGSRPGELRSQALRRYRPGDHFRYGAVIFNAKSKEGMPPELESQIVLLKDEEEIYKSGPELLHFESLGDLKRIPIQLNLNLGPALKPGNYTLQLHIKDKAAKGKNNTAAQALQFEIEDKFQ
jgi:VWFA-related protein